MKTFKVVFFLCLCFLLMVGLSFGAEKPAAAAGAKEAPKAVEGKAAAPKGVKDMTKEELVNGIVQTFNYSRNLVGVVSGMEAVKDEKGGVSYVYKGTDGKIVKLEDLPKETLEGMFLKVRSEMARMSNEQTMRQMKEMKRIQDMERQRRALATTRPVRTPTTYKAPSVPKTYQAPKVYTAPSVPRTPTRTTTR